MAYLAIKKVKGRYYGYMQESYREGGHVRTRTVEYLGAMEPAVAQQVQATRRQLAEADMKALVQSVREASQATTAPKKAAPSPPPPLAPAASPEPGQRYQRMMVNGTMAVVDTETGGIVSHDVDMTTGRLIPHGDEVITTPRPAPLRPFAEALKFPDTIAKQRVSTAALAATHRRFGEKLKALQINPAVMPDVVIKYGHPDSLKHARNGSYVITVSRNPQRRYPIALSKLWQHYRQALSAATLDAIEAERPELYNQLETRLSRSHNAAKRLLFEAIVHTPDSPPRWMLSLHLAFWDHVPRAATRKAAATDYGLASFASVKDWRGEAELILADAQKSGGWATLAKRQDATIRKHKAMITRRKNDLAESSLLDLLSGKRRKILRDIIATEAKLKAAQNLKGRTALLQEVLQPSPRPRPPAKTINVIRSKFRSATGEDLPERAIFATRDADTNAIVWNVKKAGWHRIYDFSGSEIVAKRHKD